MGAQTPQGETAKGTADFHGHPQASSSMGPLYFSLSPLRHKSLTQEDMCQRMYHECACVLVSLMLEVFLYHFPTYVMRLGLTLNLELTDLVTLGSAAIEVQGPNCLPRTMVKDIATITPTPGSSCLPSKPATDEACSPASSWRAIFSIGLYGSLWVGERRRLA